ncbi:hypothetical protein BO70DRAFT_53995 [Aspergillus heteromorphus CBS 117.55]|uniref:Uncharacterized protein n=1 Tax=Aspergillus heteromorphus CBS 117.55 TaxID=1448321 RepID=A0A317W372_9EURO|nr:uncharacterized protein BO70DRAFT_53995 [Aspergillus heteromorphus CBS 117.55]PWY79722.1 hypothetical protein BO70DRAFT_53995 [Aspergillus heteromorphus CBS 117.55]
MKIHGCLASVFLPNRPRVLLFFFSSLCNSRLSSFHASQLDVSRGCLSWPSLPDLFTSIHPHGQPDSLGRTAAEPTCRPQHSQSHLVIQIPVQHGTVP